MRISREEILGPVAAMIPSARLRARAGDRQRHGIGLCGGIVTTSLKYAQHFKRNAEIGMAMVNLPTAGVDFHAPFGGRKGSSLGSREQGALRGRVLHHGQDRLVRGVNRQAAKGASEG